MRPTSNSTRRKRRCPIASVPNSHSHRTPYIPSRSGMSALLTTVASLSASSTIPTNKSKIKINNMIRRTRMRTTIIWNSCREWDPRMSFASLSQSIKGKYNQRARSCSTQKNGELKRQTLLCWSWTWPWTPLSGGSRTQWRPWPTEPPSPRTSKPKGCFSSLSCTILNPS